MISTFTAFVDANVLYKVHLCSLILELAKTGHFRARWSEDIHREWMKALHEKRPDIPSDRIEQRRKDMDKAVPDCLVANYESLIPGLKLPDEKDRHVLAAAIIGRASVIVTFNIKHFPDDILDSYGLHAKHPDDFLLDLYDIQPVDFIDAAKADLGHYTSPALSLGDYTAQLRKAEVPKTADLLDKVGILFD